MKTLITDFACLLNNEVHWSNECHHVDTYQEFISFNVDQHDLNNDHVVDEKDYELYLNNRVDELLNNHH